MNDQIREYISGTGSNPPSYKVGDKVNMAYSVKHDKETIASFGSIYGFPLIGVIISIMLLIGVLVFSKGGYILKILHPKIG